MAEIGFFRNLPTEVGLTKYTKPLWDVHQEEVRNKEAANLMPIAAYVNVYYLEGYKS